MAIAMLLVIRYSYRDLGKLEGPPGTPQDDVNKWDKWTFPSEIGMN